MQFSDQSADFHARAAEREWAGVAAGLAWVVSAWAALLMSFILIIVLGSVLIFWRADQPWLTQAIFWTLFSYYACCVLALLAGMCMCCRAPVESGGRRYAQAAVALVGAGLVLTAVWFFWDPLHYWVAPRALIRWLLLAVDLTVLTVWISAVFAWSQFLSAVATHFGRLNLSRQACAFAIAFAAAAGCGVVSIVMTHFGISREAFDPAVLGAAGLTLVVLYSWMFVLLDSVRALVRQAGASSKSRVGAAPFSRSQKMIE
jgi:hypothetical protein